VAAGELILTGLEFVIAAIMLKLDQQFLALLFLGLAFVTAGIYRTERGRNWVRPFEEYVGRNLADCIGMFLFAAMVVGSVLFSVAITTMADPFCREPYRAEIYSKMSLFQEDLSEHALQVAQFSTSVLDVRDVLLYNKKFAYDLRELIRQRFGVDREIWPSAADEDLVTIMGVREELMPTDYVIDAVMRDRAIRVLKQTNSNSVEAWEQVGHPSRFVNIRDEVIQRRCYGEESGPGGSAEDGAN
jgi:hypothetical protein